VGEHNTAQPVPWAFAVKFGRRSSLLGQPAESGTEVRLCRHELGDDQSQARARERAE
jgi:hypothetical protein